MTATRPADDDNSKAATGPRAAASPDIVTSDGVIELRGVRVHNLKAIDVDIPLGRLTVVTGVSGSGKSSLAFDTLYAEGQRRYIETFAPAARQHLETLEKPDADAIGQIPPAIALRQNSVSRTRQATVSTVTEINDLLRNLLARSGTVVCPTCQCEVAPRSPEAVVAWLSDLPDGQKYQLAFPAITDDGSAAECLQPLQQSGYSRAILVRPDELRDSPGRSATRRGETRVIDQVAAAELDGSSNELLILVDRLAAGRVAIERVNESVESAFRDGAGRCIVLTQASIDGNAAETLQREANSGSPEAAFASLMIDTDGQLWKVQRFSQRRECTGCGTLFPEPDAALLSFRSPHGACSQCSGSGRINAVKCAACRGSRLSPQARAVRLRVSADELPLASLSVLPGLVELERCPVNELLHQIESLRASTVATSSGTATRHLFDALLPRLRCLCEAGLGYLELNRAMSDLSRGEAQRVALVSILSSQLVNSLFVLDEPSSGLHAADVARIVDLLQRLRDQGNTVVVVEHEPDVIRAADYVIEVGPDSGASGGRIVFSGLVTSLLQQSDSATATHIRSPQSAATPANGAALANSVIPDTDSAAAADSAGLISLTGCRHHTLQNLSIDFPLGCLCVVTGVSGSGKTSLVEQTLYPAVRQHLNAGADENSNTELRRSERQFSVPVCGEFDELRIAGNLSGVELIDDRPLVASRRSSAVTWLKMFGEIRTLFAETPDARNRNLTAAQFSFNTDAGGRCPKCGGTGFIEIDMQFMADVSMACPDCHGTRFLPHILEVAWRHRSIADVLAMTADEAFTFFRGERRIQKKLVALRDVGLGYLPLGQPLSTLSGGEAQRLKLAGHLAATRGTGNLLILNEPTTGLHPADVTQLLDCFRRLLTAGHSLIVIEHQCDVIRAADHIIDLGPGAGPEGGHIVAVGPLRQILNTPESRTAAVLRQSRDRV